MQFLLLCYSYCYSHCFAIGLAPLCQSFGTSHLSLCLHLESWLSKFSGLTATKPRGNWTDPLGHNIHLWLNMCHFHYRKFDTCGHYSIEVGHVCNEVLWRAGLRGVLQVCVPRILERSLEWSGRNDQEPPKPALFRGYDGFCDMCVVEFKLPCSVLQRSYSDRELDYSQPWNTFYPDDLAPCLYFGGLFGKIPELLGLSDQFEAAGTKQGPLIIFPKSLERFTWSQLRKALPFTFPGEIESDCTLDFNDTMERLKIHLGITEHDKDQIIHAIYHGHHPRAVYNRLFKSRGMPLGHFSASIANSCQQAMSLIREQEAAALKESLKQPAEYSDDSALTTLTNTPVLSDLELAAPQTPSRDTEGSDTPKNSSLTPRRPRTRAALQAARLAEQATAVKRTLATIAPSDNVRESPEIHTHGSASVIQRLATGSSPYQMGNIKVEEAQAHAGLDGGRDSPSSAHVAEHKQRSTAEGMNRSRRMAIAEQRVDEWRLGPLALGSKVSNTQTSALGKFGQELGFLKPDPQQQPADSPQKPGSKTSAAVPYYQPGRVFKWKALESPAHAQTQKVSGSAGSQERRARGQQGCSPLQMLGIDPAQFSRQPPPQQRPARAPRPPARHEEAVFISVDSDDDVKIEKRS